MLAPNFFNTILIFPFINLLLFLYQGFLLFKIPYAFGFAIVSLTALIRLALHPFFHKQTMMARKMAKLKPELDHLSKKHKGDKKKLQEEQMKLYKAMGINPASGCLFALIQMPIFIALYQVLSLFFVKEGMTKLIGEINKIIYFPFLKIAGIDPWFFGFNLGVSPSHFKQYGWYYLLIPLLTAFLQYWQVRVSSIGVLPQASLPKIGEEPKELAKKDDKKSNSDSMQTMMNTQMKFLMPLMIGWFSYTLPVGLSLYWNIFSIFSIIQTTKKVDI